MILEVITRAIIGLDCPILGFFLKNKLGQELFGDNTYLSYRNAPLSVEAGEAFTVRFRFQMPYIPAGDYMFCVACANGTQQEHVQHHWMHEALALRSQSAHAVGGLIGLPMLSIQMTKQGNA